MKHRLINKIVCKTIADLKSKNVVMKRNFMLTEFSKKALSEENVKRYAKTGEVPCISGIPDNILNSEKWILKYDDELEKEWEEKLKKDLI